MSKLTKTEVITLIFTVPALLGGILIGLGGILGETIELKLGYFSLAFTMLVIFSDRITEIASSIKEREKESLDEELRNDLIEIKSMLIDLKKKVDINFVPPDQDRGGFVRSSNTITK